jgi:hypothetical protein
LCIVILGEHAVYSYSTNTVYSKRTPTGAGGGSGGRRREVRFILAKAVNEEDDEVYVLFKAETVNTNDDDIRRTGLHCDFSNARVGIARSCFEQILCLYRVQVD